jgi:hypothetical protein
MFFVRASFNPESDIRRGFSAVGGFVWGKTVRQAVREMAEAYGISRTEARARLARHRELGGWVEPRAGLCCYAYFDTLEEALAAAPDAAKLVSGDLGASELADLYVFEGELLPQDSLDDGRVFRPTGRYWLVSERE